MDEWAQGAFDCRLEWGWRGARRAAQRGDHLIVVDVLSFSTMAATASAHGATIYPCQNEADVSATCERTGAERGVHRRDVPEKGRFSLSPVSFLVADNETRVAIASPNGATCCRLASESRTADVLIWVGAMVNARATAHAVAAQKQTTAITVLACGERWQTPDGSGDGPLRFAVEDLWGAGAILSYLPAHLSRSPEARAAQVAFLDAQKYMENNLLMCGSGQELVQRGFAGDVHHAARLNLYDAPVLFENGQLSAAPLI